MKKFNIIKNFSSFLKKQNIKVPQQQYEELEAQQILTSQEISENQLQIIEKQKILDQELNIPYKLYGMQYNQTPKLGFIGTQIFAQSKIPQNFILDHQQKILDGTLYAMANMDFEFLNEYLEQNFCNQLQQQLQILNDKKYKLSVSEDQSGIYGEPVRKNHLICDMTVIRGLSVNRSLNKQERYYHRFLDIEEMGLVIYTPQEVQDELNFIKKEDGDKAYDSYKSVILRMLVEIQSPLRLKVCRPDGEDISINNNEYAWRHLALFETQLKEPVKFSKGVQSENYMEWLTKFKFGVWKLADLDNYMLGNPLIQGQNKYVDEIFKGSKLDPEAFIDIKKVS